MNIWYGTGENAWLSNLAERPFKDKVGREYVSVEHAYQTFKSGKFDCRTYEKPWKAGSKYVGMLRAKTEDNWNIGLMEDLMLASFAQNPGIWGALCLTGGEYTHIQDKGIWKHEFPRILNMCYIAGYVKHIAGGGLAK